ncbi:MAG: helix-turn-helix domain-containing protein [Flavobacteriaceae bacterium]
MLIIKKLRRKKNINQGTLAKAIGVSLRTIQLYEQEGANIPIKNLQKIADYFEVTIADLFSYESLGESHSYYQKRTSQNDKWHTITKLAPGKYLLSVPLVIAKRQKEYVEKYEEETFLKTLPHMGFVLNQVSVAHYFAFEIGNDSMEFDGLGSIPSESIVLGKKIKPTKLPAELRMDPNSNWIIVHEKGVVCRQISHYSKKEEKLVCRRLNPSPEYTDFELDLGTVRQFFKVIKKQTD